MIFLGGGLLGRAARSLACATLYLGCATLRGILPGDAVLSVEERAAFMQTLPADVVYQSAPRVPFPVLPVQVFGLGYDLDVVLVSRHPDWDMHEYARIDLPSGTIWVAKDADREKVQTIIAPIDDIENWVPEAPVRRIEGPLEVVDKSADGRVDLLFRYQNSHGQGVEVHYQGKLPSRPNPHRNGNTMGHSRESVAALLDLDLFRDGGRADITIDGEHQKIKRLFGLYPMKFLLAQTQGGFAIADFRQEGTSERSFSLIRPGVDPSWPTHANETWTLSTTLPEGWFVRETPVTTLRYHFVNGELDAATASQAGRSTPATSVHFLPALPDVRRRFEGVVESRFVVDIAGQEGQGVGRARCWWSDENTVKVEILPEAPEWFADRPLLGTVQYDDAGATVQIARQAPA